MGPSVVNTMVDGRSIQRSLWELQKLLTDLPHDMLDDSRDSSSPEMEYSTCSNKNTGNSTQTPWTQQVSTSHAQNYKDDFDPGCQNVYVYEDGDGPLSQTQLHSWTDNHHFTHGDYTNTSLGSEKSSETVDFSNKFDFKSSHPSSNTHMEYNRGSCRDEQNHIQNLKSGASNKGESQYQASYNPHQPKMFRPQDTQQPGHIDHLQRALVDSKPQNAEKMHLAQLQILNKAQQQQIKDLERKLEDSRRNMRYIDHQFAIVKDEKDGLVVSLKESSRLVEEAKEKDVQMQNKLKAMEIQVHTFNEQDQVKQRLADAAVDSMKQQMLELRRSDTLSRAREQHDRDLAIMKEQQEATLLALQLKLDSTCEALDEQIDVGHKLRDHVKLLERQKEEEQLDRACVVNELTQRLEKSQKQCVKLLQTNSVQEMSQIQIKLQQAQSAKALSENINRVLQEDIADLKEQITLYESAVKHGVISLEMSSDWENQLSDSCMDLGLKKTNCKNGALRSTAVAHLSDTKLPEDEQLKVLRVEMQHCLVSLKGKRKKISDLQEKLQQSQDQVKQLQNKLDQANLNSSVKETSQKHPGSQEMLKMKEESQRLLEQLELLEMKNKDLKQNEEKLKSANSVLCTKMREMIQELDQEKQEAAERTERIHQQYRDDVVSRVRSELMLEYDTQLKQLIAQHQQQVQHLQTQLCEVNDKILGVQECYIAVCNEKDVLEERFRQREKQDAVVREESGAEVVKLRAEMEAQHQASLSQHKDLWSKEKEMEVQQQVVAAKAAWKEEMMEMEKTWVQRLEDAKRIKHEPTAEATCQTEITEMLPLIVSAEEFNSKLRTQKEQLLREAEKVQHKAMEEVRRRALRESQEKHLEDMAKQVEGAVSRAYNHWVEHLTTLPEYQAALQMERIEWEKKQEKLVVRETEELLTWIQPSQQEEHCSGEEKVQELQEKLVLLQSQLEQTSREQAALLKAELAGAQAAWNRDKQQEINKFQAHSEQAYQTKLEQAVQQAELQRKELLQQMEAKLQLTVKTQEEEWRHRFAEREQILTQRMREEFIKKLQTGLAEVQGHIFKDFRQDTEDFMKTNEEISEASVMHIVQTSCSELLSKAVSQAKEEWKKMSEERLGRVLQDSQEQHEREIHKLQSTLSQKKDRKDCTQHASKLQKKNVELQRHLEKACRQLQHSVREHKAAMQHVKDEHEAILQKTKEEHQQQLKEMKRASGSSDEEKLQHGLEEMKQQYLMTVEKIRADMMLYLQESRKRAAEMIRNEVQRERQDTARKMRNYYLTCLQELLEDGGKSTDVEKKIMRAASKLAGMAKVLETPMKSSAPNKVKPLPSFSAAVASCCHPDTHTGFDRKLQTEHCDVCTKRVPKKSATTSITTILLNQKEEAPLDPGNKPLNPSCLINASHLTAFPSHAYFDNTSIESKNTDFYLHGAQELPVRDQKQVNCRLTSTDSDSSSHLDRLSHSGKRVEPVKPTVRDFVGLSPDSSDLTIYNEIAHQTPLTDVFPKALHREPTPGCERQQGVAFRPMFSELRQQQDSGFHSPFYLQK
ncbi:centrosomal protein of 152 kDa isoform X3 [Gouania willdenowi]|uniref:CEP152 CEP63 binding coiled coil domain-containing protein n=1 Tax=Gouania willdenowi TaxID=441366 RepID=A0A8C5EQB4_GOUWI|nr:centrosomal protein of 152 kDa isoform X3 [Gouania willdenowi]